MSEENKNQPSHDSPQEAEPKTKQVQELSEQDLKQVAGGGDKLGNYSVQTLMSDYSEPPQLTPKTPKTPVQAFVDGFNQGKAS